MKKVKDSHFFIFFFFISWLFFFTALLLWLLEDIFYNILPYWVDLAAAFRRKNHRYKVIAFVVTLELVAVPTYWAAYIRGSYLIWPPNRFDMFLIVLRTFTYPMQIGAYFHLWFYHHYVIEG